jgi:hypothetical protein
VSLPNQTLDPTVSAILEADARLYHKAEIINNIRDAVMSFKILARAWSTGLLRRVGPRRFPSDYDARRPRCERAIELARYHHNESGRSADWPKRRLPKTISGDL